MSDTNIIVVNNADGRRYKMVMQSDIGNLTVSRIKRYLESATGLIPSSQALTFNNARLEDEATGTEIGLFDGAVLFLDAKLEVPGMPRRAGIEASSSQQRAQAHSPPLSGGSAFAIENALRSQHSQLQDIRLMLERLTAASGRTLPEAGSAELTSTRLRRHLDVLAQQLDVPQIQLDNNETAVVPVSNGCDQDVSLLLTFDRASERLYMYSTLLSSLPTDPATKNELYEMLLEGALLGREMAGGGVGVSRSSELVIMAVSFDLRNITEAAVGHAVVPFLRALETWTRKLDRFARA